MMNDKAKFLHEAKLIASQYNVPFSFFDRIITRESAWNVSAINPITGAVGLGQLMQPVVDDYNRMNGSSFSLSDVKKDSLLNLRLSAWYLGEMIPEYLRYYGKPVNQANIAWAYNAGIGRVLRDEKPIETKDYISAVATKKKVLS